MAKRPEKTKELENSIEWQMRSSKEEWICCTVCQQMKHKSLCIKGICNRCREDE
jgi:hypothetical protein